MKKLLVPFALLLAGPAVFSQTDTVNFNTVIPAQSYFIKIETRQGEKNRFVLSRFEEDTIFVIPYEKKNVFMTGIFKITRADQETGVAVSGIKNLTLRKDKSIIHPDTLEKYKSKMRAKNIGMGLLSMGAGMVLGAAIPVAGGLAALSTLNTAAIITLSGAAVVSGALVLADGGEKFILEGDKEKYKEMLLVIAGLKKSSRSDHEDKPFY